MNPITNHNCGGICSEKFCDEFESQFIELDIKGMKILLEFCDAHAEEFEKKLWEATDEK